MIAFTPLSGALTTKGTVSQVWEECPCSLGLQPLTMGRTSLFFVSFRKENDKQMPAGFSQINQCERLFSGCVGYFGYPF